MKVIPVPRSARTFGGALAALVLLIIATAWPTADANESGQGTVERIKVHGKALEGNLAGDSPNRDVSVYLPPSYKRDSNRRYPVLYMLHGFTDDDAKWFGFTEHWINFPWVIDKTLAGHSAEEMIIVMPNAYTRYKGSMYSSSVTTGDWEGYVANDLVSSIDARYRTIPDAASRGLAGHSMGGYGTLRIGMKRPDVFSSIYLLSPCCMAPGPNRPRGGENVSRVEAIKSFDDVAKAEFMESALLASAAAWAPDPTNPPLFLELPFRNGQLDPVVAAKFAANAPLAMIDQYIMNLRGLRAIAFDAGDKDERIAATIGTLDQVLNDYGVPHTYEVYEGDHVSGIADRLQTKVLPFFSKHLSFSP